MIFKEKKYHKLLNHICSFLLLAYIFQFNSVFLSSLNELKSVHFKYLLFLLIIIFNTVFTILC